MSHNLVYNLLRTIKLSGDINSCNFSQHNSLAIGTSDKSVSVWEWSEEGFRETFYSPLLNHDYAVTSVVFSPDGLILATSSTDGMTYIINVKTGTVKACIVQSIGGGVRESSISPPPHQLLATVTDEGYIFLWNLVTCQIQRYWLGHEACISSLAFSPDCYLLATGDTDGTYKLWLVDHAVCHLFTADRLYAHIQKDSHDGALLTLAFSPNSYTELITKDYQLCSGGDDNMLRLWHISICMSSCSTKDYQKPVITVKLLKVLEGHLSSVTCVKFSPDGRFIGSTSLDSSARIWEVSSGVCLRVLGGHLHSVFCCAFSTELAFFASGSNDKTVNVWQLTNKTIPVTHISAGVGDEDCAEKALGQRCFDMIEIININSHVNAVDFNNSHDLVVGGSDKMVRAFAQKGPKYKELPMSPMKGHAYSVASVEFSRCGRYLVTASIDGAIIVWNYLNGEMINKPFHLSSQGGRAARFSPSTDCLAIGGNDGKAYLWSINSQSISHAYPGHIESVNCVAFTPDQEYLATGCAAGQLKVWKSNPACSLCQLLLENVHDLGVISCDFSHNFIKDKASSARGYRLATGGNDCIVRVFKMWPIDDLVMKFEEMFFMRGHGGSITQVRFSSKSSDVLASTAIDRTTRIWNMQNGQCLNVLSYHKNQVTCCAFSPDATLLATGSLDSSVIIWEVPKVISLQNKHESDANGKYAVNPDEALDSFEALTLEDVQLDDLVTAFKMSSADVPNHMICPITQQVMIDPVICEDGFTYEHDAIRAWMVNGRNTSPITNVPLSSTLVVPNTALRAEIKQFLLLHYNAGYKST
ncbi:WD repeat, SAM and U-box domain-containing protein 1-like [Homalodisca vitripennis]|uniref:U-box domain-containing protein n=1 Tax=Homalodisca liturata TaxID=320908 RepID=A0A1B6HGF0_9HEMI|nr:WD repeat, SAM and U-box domain-containing protein 1-like [Homalodisca vitripennis]